MGGCRRRDKGRARRGRRGRGGGARAASGVRSRVQLRRETRSRVARQEPEARQRLKGAGELLLLLLSLAFSEALFCGRWSQEAVAAMGRLCVRFSFATTSAAAAVRIYRSDTRGTRSTG